MRTRFNAELEIKAGEGWKDLKEKEKRKQRGGVREMLGNSILISNSFPCDNVRTTDKNVTGNTGEQRDKL